MRQFVLFTLNLRHTLKLGNLMQVFMLKIAIDEFDDEFGGVVEL